MLLRFRKDYPEDLAVSYHYVPLEYHKRAYEAARAAECASDQDHFAEMHDAIFKHFSGLDTLSFKSVAQEAGVPNLAEFAKCAARTDSVPRINADRALALDTLQIRGTPSVVVNGMLYNFSPSVGEITKLLKDARARRLAKNGIASN